jgi:hypothetical protein
MCPAMYVDEVPSQYVVRVPAGMSVAAAVAEHRDRTGHGGMCMLVFPQPEKRRSKRNARAKG